MEILNKKPQLRLISKKDFEEVKSKYDFLNEVDKTSLSGKIASASPSDVLALTLTTGSGLKIINVEILNEQTEKAFANLLIKGA